MNRFAFMGQPMLLLRSPLTYAYAQPDTSTYRFRACLASAPLDKLLNVARHKLSPSGLEITSIEWQSHVLTVFVARDNGEGVTAHQCAEASTIVGDVIEQENLLGDSAYTLQVSTPGAAEVLTELLELEAFRGFPVCVKTRETVNQKKVFWGTLADSSEECVSIGVKGRVIRFRRQIVEQIRLCTAQELQQSLRK